jgi:hypothetical protein
MYHSTQLDFTFHIILPGDSLHQKTCQLPPLKSRASGHAFQSLVHASTLASQPFTLITTFHSHRAGSS